MCMKDIIKNLIVGIYCLGLFGSLGYSILNPAYTYKCLKTWEGDPLTRTASIILISSWILIGILIIWMIIDKSKLKRERK